MLDEYLKLSERTKAESDRDYAEMRAFTRARAIAEPRLPRVGSAAEPLRQSRALETKAPPNGG